MAGASNPVERKHNVRRGRIHIETNLFIFPYSIQSKSVTTKNGNQFLIVYTNTTGEHVTQRVLYRKRSFSLLVS